ncbi:hypothetical protein ACGFSI_23220 [Streptomyces virginiae]|uniref:hypothetical protein n=1 Tax=Streptomyces virginiae TaxID=1961 RepID=UPI003716D75C
MIAEDQVKVTAPAGHVEVAFSLSTWLLALVGAVAGAGLPGPDDRQRRRRPASFALRCSAGGVNTRRMYGTAP